MEYVGGLGFARSTKEDVTQSFFDINTQAHYPFYKKRFDIYAKFGAGVVDLGGSGYTLVYGLGAAYRIDERYGVRIGYDYFDYGIDDTGDSVVDKKLSTKYLFCVFEVQF